MDDLILATLALCIPIAGALGAYGGYRYGHRNPIIPDLSHEGMALGPERPSRTGRCDIREFTYDGSDSIRRAVAVHSACDGVSFRDPLGVARAADKKIAPLVPGGVSHKLVAVRDSEHEVKG